MFKLDIKKNRKEKSIKEELSPRDLLFLKNLTKHGLTLIEIKISPISPVVNHKISDITLPKDSIIVNIIRNNHSHFPSDEMILFAKDIVYILASQVVENDLREVFIPNMVFCS